MAEVSGTADAGQSTERDAEQRDYESDECTAVFEQDDRELRRFGASYEPHHRLLPAYTIRLDDRGAKRERFDDDREQQ